MAVDKNKVTAEAAKLIQKGQYDKAIRAYEKILADDPKDVRFLLKIGELQQKKGDQRAAAETFGRVADAYGEQGFFLKAVAVYKQMLKLAPDDVRVNERLAALYQQLGLMSEAMAQLNAIAAAAERGGDDPKLLEVLRRMVDLDPENVGSAIKLGELHARQSNTPLALQQLRRAADQLKRTGRTDEYVKVAERMTFLAPEDDRLMRELAAILLARGDTKRALSRLQQLFKRDPGNVETLNLLAQSFQELGQVSKMVSVYKELAQVHAAEGREQESRAAWRRVLELAPDDADAAQAVSPPAAADWPTPSEILGESAVPPPLASPPDASGGPTPAPAPSAATEAPSASPDAIPKLLTETDVYVKYGLHEKALEHLEKVFAIDPDHLEAREKALRVRADRGDAAGAAEEAVRVAQLARARGLADRAEAALARLRELAPSHPALVELSAGAAPAAEPPPAGDDGLVLEIEPPPEGDDVALAAAVGGEDGAVDEAAGIAPPPLPEAADPVIELEEAEVLSEELVIEEEWSVAPPEAPATAVEAVDGGAAAVEAGEATGEGVDAVLEDELAELDFFLEQGLLEDAGSLLDELLAAHPSHPALQAKLAELEAARSATPPPLAMTAPPPRPVRPAPAPAADYLYSVEDVFGRFKQQVAQTIDPGDSATHYDLGIAYKEMGLLDDALREFELVLAAGGPARALDCLTMIGVCRMDSGDPRGAVEAFRRALRSEAVPPDALCAVEYQLAMAHAAAGETDAALHHLHRVLERDPGYRDARAVVARLGGGPGRPPPGEEPPPRPRAAAPAPPGDEGQGGASGGGR